LLKQGRYSHKEIFSEVGVKIRDADNTTRYRNHILVKTLKNQYDVFYKLKTPMFEEEETVTLNAIYAMNPFHSIRSKIYYPESTFATGLDFDYKSVWNMNGTLNTTTPFKGLDQAGVNLEAVTLT
jgi:hypothetical protein